jgi:hypothetical protein
VTIKKYRTIRGDGTLISAHRSEEMMQPFVDMGLVVECLPDNPNSSIYGDEDVIYGGYRFDPLDVKDILKAYPQLLKIYQMLRSGAITSPI